MHSYMALMGLLAPVAFAAAVPGVSSELVARQEEVRYKPTEGDWWLVDGDGLGDGEGECPVPVKGKCDATNGDKSAMLWEADKIFEGFDAEVEADETVDPYHPLRIGNGKWKSGGRKDPFKLGTAAITV